MSKIVVLGAGPTGLSSATLLAADGHEVTVLERDERSPKGGAGELWEAWERRGVSQFRLLHIMMPRWRAVMEAQLPEVVREVEALGGTRVNMLGMISGIENVGPPFPGDERFDTIAARRPVLEAAVAGVAGRTPGLTIRRGVTVTGLLAGPERTAGVPHVTGVRIRGGERVEADLVVDASGRVSSVPGMIRALGAEGPAEERQPSGFVYYCRHFRTERGGGMPVFRGWMLEHFDGMSTIKTPSDNGTYSTTFVISSRDKRLRELREPAVWSRVMELFPHCADWAKGEPVSGVQAMAGLEERYRRFVVGDRPVVTGLVTIGDAWACTNPSLGVGTSMGLLHACALRDVLRETGTDAADKLVGRFDEVTEAELTPVYRRIVAWGEHRAAEIDADIAGEPHETDDPDWAVLKALDAAKFRDPDVLRAMADMGSFLAEAHEALARPGLVERIMTLSAGAPRYTAPGPTRAEVLAAVEG